MAALSPSALRRRRLAQISQMQFNLLRQIDRVYFGLSKQIERAYLDRIRPGASRKARAALNFEYYRQAALAVEERDRQVMLTHSERDRQTALTEAEYTLSKSTRKRVSHAKTASRFWKHFARDGRPVPPWEISVGPGLDIDQGETGASIWDEPLFAEGDYSYEDFNTDWGGYESEDTGYPDENT